MKLEMVGISIYGSLRGVARFPVSYVRWAYPSAVFRPTVIDKSWPIESIGSPRPFDSVVRARSTSRRTTRIPQARRSENVLLDVR